MAMQAIPLVVVPFMGNAGRRVCLAAHVSWLDLCGNAHIIGPGLRIIVDGQPNQFNRPGRPASLFAPKSSRVVRCLLMHVDKALTQRQIARLMNMSEGFVSRIVTRLEHENYVVRESSGALRVKDPNLLLDAWQDTYQFSKHKLIRGYVPARSGDALVKFVSDTLIAEGLEHAVTGLAAAWQLTHFAAFRLATFFLTSEPSSELKSKLNFRESIRGANLWLVMPNDEAVLAGAQLRHHVCCVHPLQAYLDLKEHPERAPEAAEYMRNEWMNGYRHGS